MNKIDSFPIAWGLADLLSIGWYASMNAYRGQIPMVHDIREVILNIDSFGLPDFGFLIYIAVILYVSPILSGVLLILRKRSGTILSYIQTPFRLILIIPPSIFFILWPLDKFIQPMTILWIGFGLVLFSETIKITSLVWWNKRKIA